MSSKTYPSLNLETELAAGGTRYVLGIDEVGRGALAGPVAVGIAVIDMQNLNPWPPLLRDSKLISAKVRQELVAPLSDWVSAYAIGYASAHEIDTLGITKCLSLSAHRAFEQLSQNTKSELLKHRSSAILDGSHNWLGALGDIQVKVQTKADRDCASVAAASVLSKVARDELMIELSEKYSGYAWDENKGYASPNHISALQEFGPVAEHRKTWLSNILGDNKLFDL
ncbi:MAG: ribonuclease HII [Micrococcales bacterium]